MANATHGRRASDDVGLFMLKLSLFGALLGILATTVGDTATGIVLFAAAAGALGWGWRKIVTPLVNLSSLLERLPAWTKTADDEFAEIHRELQQIKKGAEEAATRAEAAMNIAEAVKRQLGATARGDDE